MLDRLAPGRRTVTATLGALRNRGIRRTSIAFLAFNAVEMASWTTILVYAYGATGPASVGVVAIVQLLPSAALAPLLANIGDRYPRVLVLIGWFLAQAATLTATGAAILLGGPPALVYSCSALATIALTQTRPILASLLPELADGPDELTAANALSSISVGLGGFLGPLVAALLLGFSDAGVTFVVTGLVLVAGAVLLVGLHGHAGTIPAADDEHMHGLDPRSVLAGLGEVARDRDVLVVMTLLAGELLIFGGLEVLLVLMAIELMGIGESGAGFLLGALGLGSILGGATAFGLAGRRRLAPWLGVGALVVGLPVALIGIDPAARPAAVLLTITGVGFAILDVTGMTLLQRITPDVVRARVFGVLEGLLLVGEAVGSLIVPPIALVLGLQGAAIALGLMLPLMALLVVGRFARIDARVRIPEAELRALRGVPMFAPLAAGPLETLARHLGRLPVAAGSVLIREGDIGDRWYLADSGRYLVTVGDDPRPDLGPGDAFGEIALLRDVPRTATVTAATDGVLWVLEREQFLAAVTGSPAAMVEAEQTALARLGA